MKKPLLEFDNHIKDKDDLISQLESLKAEAMHSMMNALDDFRDVFVRDYHALRIVINYIKEVK